MNRSPRLRRKAVLTDSLHQQLSLYALAATAASVASLTLAPAEAKIVYTPSHIPINVDGNIVNLDLNHDGINDFSFYAGYVSPGVRRGLTPPEGNHWSNLAVTPLQQSNGAWAVESKGHLCAAAEPKGKPVGSHRKFQPGKSVLPMAFASGDSTGGTAFCPWLKVQQSYVGLKFVIQGKVHFGWARINRINGNAGFPAVIDGYAYESVPGKPIVTGKTKGQEGATIQPASLVHIARGATASSE